VLIDVLCVRDQSVGHQLLELDAWATKVRKSVDDVLHQMKSIQVGLNAHVERRGDRPRFLVAPNGIL
jgi:hypothetical protein